MQLISNIVSFVEQNKIPLGIAAAWLLRELPILEARGGIVGIVKAVFIGTKATSPAKVSAPVTITQ